MLENNLRFAYLPVENGNVEKTLHAAAVSPHLLVSSLYKCISHCKIVT